MKMRLVGVKEIDAVFNGLPHQLQDKVLQDAHAQALKITVNKAKLLAPEGPTGNLVDSIGIVKSGKRNKAELGLVAAGPRRRGKAKGYHAHMVEYGTRRRHTKKGANRGVMPANPFMEPAWRQTKSEVLQSISVNLARKLNNFMRRTIRR